MAVEFRKPGIHLALGLLRGELRGSEAIFQLTNAKLERGDVEAARRVEHSRGRVWALRRRRVGLRTSQTTGCLSDVNALKQFVDLVDCFLERVLRVRPELEVEGRNGYNLPFWYNKF